MSDIKMEGEVSVRVTVTPHELNLW